MGAFNPWASSLIAYRYSEKKTKYLVASRRYRIILEYIVLYLPTCGTMPLTILSKIPNLFKVILIILLVYHISHDKHPKWSTQPLLTSIKKTHKKGLIVYCPYLTRLQSLTIWRCYNKRVQLFYIGLGLNPSPLTQQSRTLQPELTRQQWSLKISH